MLKVSIIIPAYNCSRLIGRTIQSVRSQTFKDWELIIVDDGSTDNTRETVLSFQAEDPRIKYFHQPNSGAPAGPKNTGLSAASGEYIAFLDHDDEWLPQKLEKHLSVFSGHDEKLGLVASNAMIINEETGEKKEYRLPADPKNSIYLLEGNFIFCSSGVMVRKSVFDKVGLFDENFKLGDDWDMWLRISLNYDFDFVHEPLYIFYRHSGTVTSKMRSTVKIKDYNYGLSKHIDLYKRSPRQFSSRLLTMGRICYVAGEKKQGIAMFAWAGLVQPFRAKVYVNLLFALMGPQAYRAFLYLRNLKNN